MRRFSLLRIFFIGTFLVLSCSSNAEVDRLEAIAERVEIIRDDFGVPHVYAKTDADAVFGMLYAQCEDDFNRVEQNYIWAIGRLAEVEGESALYSDVRARLFMTQEEAKRPMRTVQSGYATCAMPLRTGSTTTCLPIQK
jgi:acyl-homoserine-lactone acylase